MRLQSLFLFTVFSTALSVSAMPQTGESSSSLHARKVDLEPAHLSARGMAQLATDHHLSARDAYPFAKPDPEAEAEAEAEAFGEQNLSDSTLEKRVLTHNDHAAIHNSLAAAHTQTAAILTAGGHHALAAKHHAAATAHTGAAQAHTEAHLGTGTSAAAHTASKQAHAASMKAHRASGAHH